MTEKQVSLFETAPDPWDLDSLEDCSVATVVITTGPDRVFDYLVPDRLRDKLAPGRRVKVPFGRGNRLVVGYCVKLELKPVGSRQLKEIHSLVDSRALLSPSMLRLTQWMAEYYLCPWGQVLEAVLPAGVRGQAGTRETLFLTVPGDVVPRIDELKLRGNQPAILRHLAGSPTALTLAELCAAADCTQAQVRALRKKGLIVTETRRVAGAGPAEIRVAREEHLTLEADQQAALAAILKPIAAGSHQTILIHGVTGSGKTEVYIQAIQEVLGHARQAIVLVPEISLTPQTEQRFRSRFGQVAVLHSHMTDADRHHHWQRIAAGQVQVIVGARSAVFAPTPRLGLIILDEEHESTFKQGEAPRYHAREVALRRARDEAVPLVLGSATPSLESWHRAQTGEFQLVSMPRRVFNRPMPDVATIDLRLEFKDRRRRGAISRQLQNAMNDALGNDGQVILLLNRRGYATHIQCPSCGFAMRCPNCTIALTHHVTDDKAVCHYCDYEVKAPTVCPDCNFPGIHYGGLGTQKLEAEVRAKFPDHRCLRMDTDTMDKPGSHEKALASFRDGHVRILLGTQMIAKGLDFPNVTLVGVVNADTALHLADFRAAERTFQLVTQVAGRTGRGARGGRVLVQTFSPEHPAILAAVRHDYARFAENELPGRQTLAYSPFNAMARIVVRGPQHATTEAFAMHVGSQLREAIARQQLAARVLGPAPAPISKLRGKYRFHMQLQSADGPALRNVISQATAELKPPDEVQWIVDIDPLEML